MATDSAGKVYLFDSPNVPLVYATPGVNLDFIEHPVADIDADIVADSLTDAIAEDSPIQLLEKSIGITGAAQTLEFDAPQTGDVSQAAVSRISALELAIQLNELSVPKTDVNLTIEYLNAAGVAIGGMTQQITGNASISSGNNRQYIRFLPFARNTKASSGNLGQFVDGKVTIFPQFTRPEAAAYAALVAAVPNPALVFPNLAYDVAKVRISIPASSMAVGAQLTLTVVTAGRKKSIKLLVDALDAIGAADASASEVGNEAASMKF